MNKQVYRVTWTDRYRDTKRRTTLYRVVDSGWRLVTSNEQG